MRYFYAPWRQTHIKEVRERSIGGSGGDCLFCTQFLETDDAKNLILARTQHSVIMLNLYPYNAGHILILPLKHVGSIIDLSREEAHDIMSSLQTAATVLKQVLQSEGINIGMNIGQAAGASIPGHLHAHILPRWIGDTNFLPLIAETKTISIDMRDIYARLKPVFNAVMGETV